MKLSRSTFASLLIVLLFVPSGVLGAGSVATSFCKCICFNNSTIIALNPPPSSTQASSLRSFEIRSPHARPFHPVQRDDADPKDDPDSGRPPQQHHKLTCADCTRAFCLDYNLPICKNARDEDVFTTCFQRDSLKDETVVVIFVFATAGLLAWALVKPWVDRLRERNTFRPLAQDDQPQYGGGGATHTDANRPSRRTAPNVNAGEGSNSVRPPARPGNTRADRGGVGHYEDDDRASSVVPPRSEVHADQDALDIVSGSGSRL